MPTEVAMSYTLPSPYMSAPGAFTTAPAHHSPHHLSTETKSGALTLISPNGRRQGVNAVVYQTTLEHFAVLYPQKKICRPLGVINIKTTTLERLQDKSQPHQAGFSVRQLGFDTPMTLTFLCEPRELDSWMAVFQHTKSVVGGMGLRHQSSLPCVEEDEEF